jgi:predicted signal transduction protein with EAL and GGDEF domain
LRFPHPLAQAYQDYFAWRFRAWITLAATLVSVALAARTLTVPFFTLHAIPPVIVVDRFALPTLAVFLGWNVVGSASAALALLSLLRGGTVIGAQRVAMVGGAPLIVSFVVAHNLRGVPSYLRPNALPLAVFALVLGFRRLFVEIVVVSAIVVVAPVVAAFASTFPMTVNAAGLFLVVPYRLLAVLSASLLERDARNDFLGRRALLRRQAALAALSERLAADAATDPLTRVANRRKFEQTLRLEWRRARRSGTPISLLMVDIDHFKRLNDRLATNVVTTCCCSSSSEYGPSRSAPATSWPATEAKSSLSFSAARHRRRAAPSLSGSDEPSRTCGFQMRTSPTVR